MEDSTNREPKIVVLGAGPVGLVTAWQLLKQDKKVIIFEKNDRVGGMCRTWKWGDFLVDTGPHIFHTPDTSLATFWEDTFGELFVKGEFWCKNVRGKNFDEYWDYPLSWESISKFPIELKKTVLDELRQLDPEGKARATNYSDYIKAQVGETLAEMFFRTYPEKVWGISTTEMTSDWAPKRIEFRNQITPFYSGQWNAVGKYGTGCIYEHIEDEITKLGGQICFEKTAVSFKRSDTFIEEIEFTDGEKLPIAQHDKIISSLPITLTARLLGQSSSLEFRGIKSVYLSYNKPSILPKHIHWLYYGSEEIWFNRVTEPKKLSECLAPEDTTYLTAEITFSPGDFVDQISNDELETEISKQIERVGLARCQDVQSTSVNVERFVYPLQFLGYQAELSQIKAEISRFQQLYSIGTGGDYNYADSQILFHKAFDVVEVICGKDSANTQVIRQVPSVKLNEKVRIESKVVGDGEPTFIIAEAGLNHNGSLIVAKQLVDAAVESGCDAIKFQTFTKDSRISARVKGARYSEKIIGLEETMPEMFNRLALEFDQQEELFIYARKKGIEVFSTPFDYESVEFLESMEVNLYKIASMDLVNLPLIKRVGETGKPVILSTGMSTLGQVEEAVSIFRETGNKNLMLLHCNSSYPAAPKEMNLKVIPMLKKAFGIPVGLSDHTFGLFAAHTALAIGANIVERHFSLDRALEGPDHILSSEPDELAELVSMAKKITLVLGDGLKRIQPNEYDTLNSQRKSLYARVDIKKGATITSNMISIKGPGGGLLPRYLEIVIGRKASSDIESDHPITWENV